MCIRDRTKAALQQIVEARKFAIDELNLPDNGSYRTYVDLERSSVVWNVVATKEFVIDPKTWCFPFAGCVSYRGYFDESVANHFAERLKSDGLDTVVVGAAAYSTLGFFEDPILNTMIDIGGQNGASIIIHELAHQKLYVNDDSELNEAFAAQALSVIKALDFDIDKVNVNGGAVALGHPLGMTGAKLSIQLINEMKRRSQKYGIVTACVGGGQGVCGVFENL